MAGAAGGADVLLLHQHRVRPPPPPAVEHVVVMLRARVTGLARGQLPSRTVLVPEVGDHPVDGPPRAAEGVGGDVTSLRDGLTRARTGRAAVEDLPQQLVRRTQRV